MDADLPSLVLILFALVGLKSLIFGQYWPWQYKGQCPYCKRKWEEK